MLYTRYAFSAQCLEYAQKGITELAKRKPSLFHLKKYKYSCKNVNFIFTTEKEKRKFTGICQHDDYKKGVDGTGRSHPNKEERRLELLGNEVTEKTRKETEIENASGIMECAEEEKNKEEAENFEDRKEQDEQDDIEDDVEDSIEDDIDTLLYTNKLNSSFVGELWHTSANSYYKQKQMEKENGSNKTYMNKEMHNIKEEEKTKNGNDKTHAFIKQIYEEEKKEAEELQEYFVKNEEKLINFRNTIFCRLKLAEELSQNFDHASKDALITTEQAINQKKEEYYKKIINSLNGTSTEESDKRKKKQRMNYAYDTVETIKILDIDSLPCNVLNNLFAYKIVKNCSAEICLKIITRLGMYRDKYTQISYENMITYIGSIIKNEKNAEIIALFCRCYETISIPFLINYVRKYGSFSRGFLVNMYDKFFKKRLFDFIRYENNMGIRKIPNILTHPYHLSSYVKLLGECSAKKDMYIQLKMKGFIPNSFNYEPEKITENSYLETDDNTHKRKIKKVHLIEKHEKGKEKKRNNFVERPRMYDVILSAEYSGMSIENFIEKEEGEQKHKHKLSHNVKEMEPYILIDEKTHTDKIVSSKEKETSFAEKKAQQEAMKREELQQEEVKREEVKKEDKKKKENKKEENKKEEDKKEENKKEEDKKEENKETQENVNFTMEEECDVYLYRKLNRLNSTSFVLQTTLVKTNEGPEKNKLIDYEVDDTDLGEIKEVEKYEDSLWDLPWKTKKRNSFFFKGRFFKIVPGEGWKQIEDVSKKYIKPKRKRQKHSIRRKRILERKIKINLFKKKILEKHETKKKMHSQIIP